MRMRDALQSELILIVVKDAFHLIAHTQRELQQPAYNNHS